MDNDESMKTLLTFTVSVFAIFINNFTEINFFLSLTIGVSTLIMVWFRIYNLYLKNKKLKEGKISVQDQTEDDDD